MVTAMTVRRFHRYSRAGYTLIEVLAAAGLVSAAIRYAEALARLWQLGVNPADVMLSQTQGSPGSSGNNPMTYTFSGVSSTSVGDDGGITEGSVEQATVSVTYLPYGNADTAQATITLDVLRPASSHR